MVHKKKSDKNMSGNDGELYPMRLGKFIAKCGILSRRKAGELVKEGKVYLNGEVHDNPATQITERDEVTYKGKVLKPEVRMLYILLNKSRNTITTMEDEKGRRSVNDIFKGKIRERLFPVGRLDRNTSGLLLMTNDGSLAEKLAHPRNKVTKVYLATLDRVFSKADMKKLREGITLDDGEFEVDAANFIEYKPKNVVGVEIHSGQNRIVRRIFESMEYEVVKLDRIIYANLTKKNLPRGEWRYLTKEEIRTLKHFSG
jgi:23S rRNA pseudouridine2605 synthase